MWNWQPSNGSISHLAFYCTLWFLLHVPSFKNVFPKKYLNRRYILNLNHSCDSFIKVINRSLYTQRNFWPNVPRLRYFLSTFHESHIQEALQNPTMWDICTFNFLPFIPFIKLELKLQILPKHGTTAFKATLPLLLEPLLLCCTLLYTNAAQNDAISLLDSFPSLPLLQLLIIYNAQKLSIKMRKKELFLIETLVWKI